MSPPVLMPAPREQFWPGCLSRSESGRRLIVGWMRERTRDVSRTCS